MQDVRAVFLAGSLAKGTQRPESDVDGIVVLTEDAYARRLARNAVSECVHGQCTYQGGYFDVKYVCEETLRLCALKGSEPTRNAYVGARPLLCRDEALPALVAQIARYPQEEYLHRLFIFYAGFTLNKGFFFRSALEVGDEYLLSRSCVDTVYFGMRMLFAYNRVLFPCHKAMMRYAQALPQKPQNIIELGEALVRERSAAARDAFAAAILGFTSWPLEGDNAAALSTYVRYAEQWWMDNLPNIYEM